MDESGFAIRRARASDREELLAMVGSAFAAEGEAPLDFGAIQPHLFVDERIGHHFIRVEKGRIVGCVGLYPYPMRIAGVPFRVAGLGQVGTRHEARGRGVMGSILEAVWREVEAQQYDFV